MTTPSFTRSTRSTAAVSAVLWVIMRIVLLIATRSLREQIDDIPAVGAVEIARWLVGENELGPHDQCAADGDALLLAAGKLARQMMAPRRKPEHLEDLINLRLLRLAIIGATAEKMMFCSTSSSGTSW